MDRRNWVQDREQLNYCSMLSHTDAHLQIYLHYFDERDALNALEEDAALPGHFPSLNAYSTNPGTQTCRSHPDKAHLNNQFLPFIISSNKELQILKIGLY